ncbi:MAG: efflux RND transporter periplasmic adaptor subunit [Planctomycetes bacterium]|nr:efflux RND transporter periplasmic adaptor subunit [Planctomycetota bacterium]
MNVIVQAIRGRAAAVTALLIGMALSIGGCSKEPAQAQGAAPPAPKAPPKMPVRVAQSVKADVPVSVDAIAWVKAFSIITVKPQVSAMALKKHMKPGDHVTVGQVLYTLDARPFEAALAQAQADMERDKALASKARAEADRDKQLVTKNAASEWELEQAVATAKAADAQVAADEAMIHDAQLKIEHCTIKSPIDGYVGPTLTDAGNVVKENDTELIVLRQVQPIYVEMAVPQDRLPAIRAAMDSGNVPVDVTIAGEEDKPEVGRLAFINNTVNEDAGTITLRAVFDNPSLRLWPGLYVQASIHIGTDTGAVLVPDTAIQTGQNGTYVYIVQPDNTVESVPVTIGRQHAGSTVILTGVEPGQTIVTDGQLRLAPGMGIQIITDAKKPADADSGKAAP